MKKVAAAPLTGRAGLLAVTSDRATWRNTVMRVRYIHEEIRSGRYPNGPKLAKHFGVNIRTIYRDIEAMRNSLDLPMEYSAARNGFYYTR
ncbi:MAG: HTH domain-containing protein [Verrucomicrobiaceae bacterium]|nr:MAG: HTH domain-containing protein [Verrucomicrobiaceae bacterium]